MDNIIYKIGNIKYLLVFSLLLFLTSCSAEIESASANSTSAILAVCGTSDILFNSPFAYSLHKDYWSCYIYVGNIYDL